MLTKNLSTTEQLNKIIEFRQTIYDRVLTKNRDALFELLDALLSTNGKPGCFAELSLSPVFRRKWSSVYKAIERGEHSAVGLSDCFRKQVPRSGIQVYALDTTVWSHPQARTLEGQVFAGSPTRSIKKHSVVRGHQYSLLTWTPAVRESWSLALSNRRLKPQEKAIEVGIEQIETLCQARPDPLKKKLDVIVADGHYGNHRFFAPLKALNCAGLARLRKDRVLYGPPPPYGGHGRPRVHGDRFAFKEPDTWSEPDEWVELTHPRWGQVRLRRWNNLHAKQDAQTDFSVVLAEVHRERDKPPGPLWLGYVPGHTDQPLEVVWGWFDYRWPIEPSIRFRKQSLFWMLPRFQKSKTCDRWTDLVDLAFWQLFLARPLVQDEPLPWQKPQARLTPYRVKQSLGSIFGQFGTPTTPPQTRGKSPGWPLGRLRTPPERFDPVKRRKKALKSA